MGYENHTINAWRRENGRVGVRNHVIILPVDDISNAACEAVGNGAYTLGTFEAAYLPLVLITADVDVDQLDAGALELHIVWRSHEIGSRVA